MKEFYDLARQMEEHHAVFAAMQALGRPNFREDIPTAGIRFDRVGGFISFDLNPHFWAELTDYEKKFVIAHECLHVILSHGLRGKTSKLANVAMDIVVNHSLINRFGFVREKLPGWERYCWADTLLKNVPDNLSFEEYVVELEKLPQVDASLVDSHEGLSENWGRVLDEVRNSLSTEEQASLNSSHFIPKKKVVTKKKWETVIKKWAKQFEAEEDDDQWTRPNRRFASLGSDFMIPTEQPCESRKKNRITVHFFQDVSLSCFHLIERFLNAARSLPKSRFDVKLHAFSTFVNEIDFDTTKFDSGGGTMFDIIEHHIQKQIKKGSRYPDAVFIVTDGEGTTVVPEKPERWYWFLSSDFKACIPEKSKTFMLKDFE